MTNKLPMMIAVRGYAVSAHDEDGQNKGKSTPRWKIRKNLPRPSDEAVIFDTETTTDHRQNARIGTYQVRKKDQLTEKGIFYEPDGITSDEMDLLTSYAKTNGLTVRTREDFVRNVLYVIGYDHGGQIIGFNLPFDLSRLALKISTSHGKDMRGGFSLELLPEKWQPNILIKHLNSRSAFMRFAAAPGPVDGRGMRNKGFKTRAKTGYFQDLKTLSSALLGRSHSLGSLARFLETQHQKLDTDEHGGPLTPEYLDYAMTDTDVTWDCYQALGKLYADHGLTETPPHRIYSEASLGKAYLRQMGVERWTKLQPDFSPELLGVIMSTYYGGRSEVRIRRQLTRVLYCDFRSMYPTVCTLMGLWRFVIAKGVEHEDWTAEARMLLARVGTGDLRYQNIWPFLTTLVQIEPEGDVLPVRAPYGESSRTIGLNKLSAPFGMWYTLADCIASKLQTGKAPIIIKAIRFTPKGRQDGLRPITIGGNEAFRIDPNDEDFDLYRRIIELRGEIQSEYKKAISEGRTHEAEALDAYQQMLKLLANSTSYGIFAEMNVQSYDRPRDFICYGAEHAGFHTGTKSIEEAGTHFHPLLATLITGAARLMLSIAECVAAAKGIGWALCDTDSLALARPEGMGEIEFIERATAVTKWFDALNPYSDDKPLFKIEDQNWHAKDGKSLPGEHEPLYAIAVSAKRYVLFNLQCGKPIIRKAVAHGLGHLRPPYREADAPASIPAPSLPLPAIGVDRWQYDVWYQIVMAELEGHPDQVDLSPLTGLDRPAASRYSASTPMLLHWFDAFNHGRPYVEQVKAFNFMLAFHVSKPRYFEAIANGKFGDEIEDGGLPAVIAPYDDDSANAAGSCFDRRNGNPVPISILATYREALSDYHLHSEAKFSNGNTTDQGVTVRRHVEAIAIEYIGKEANRWEDQFFLGEMAEAQIEYGASPESKIQLTTVFSHAARKFGIDKLADTAGLSRQQLSFVMNRSCEPRPQTIKAVLRAIMILEEDHHADDERNAAVREVIRIRISRTSLSAVAGQLRVDPSNLGKMLSGTRPLTSDVIRRASR